MKGTRPEFRGWVALLPPNHVCPGRLLGQDRRYYGVALSVLESQRVARHTIVVDLVGNGPLALNSLSINPFACHALALRSCTVYGTGAASAAVPNPACGWRAVDRTDRVATG